MSSEVVFLFSHSLLTPPPPNWKSYRLLPVAERSARRIFVNC